MWMRIIIYQLEVIILEIEDTLHVRIDFHLRQGTRFARQLQFHLLQVVQVDVRVAQRVDEVACL